MAGAVSHRIPAVHLKANAGTSRVDMVEHEGRQPGLDSDEFHIRDLRLPQILLHILLRLAVSGEQLDLQYRDVAEERFVREQPFRAALHLQIRLVASGEEETKSKTIRRMLEIWNHFR